LLYLKISHGSGALPWMNWGLPALCAGGIVTATWAVAPGVNAFHAGGVFDRLLGFMQSLPGFYLAALAAVATFNRPGLDTLMPGSPPRVKILFHGREELVELTRRRFLCLIFSYLTALSFALTLALVLGLPLVAELRASVSHEVASSLRLIVSGGLAFFVAQMLVITLWGLFYLGERVHTPD
jgi:hypothetical protein